jgi:hypothetical protein
MKDLNGICNVYYKKQGNEIAQSSTQKWKQKHVKTTVFATSSKAYKTPLVSLIREVDHVLLIN